MPIEVGEIVIYFRCLIGEAFFIGAGATMLMDGWIYALNRSFGLPMTNWALAGRWFWNARTGRLYHDDISLAVHVENELAFGWFCHYAIGVIYAGIFILVLPGWVSAPRLFPVGFRNDDSPSRMVSDAAWDGGWLRGVQAREQVADSLP